MRYSSLSLKELICLLSLRGPRDDEAWEEFVSRVGKPISLTIMRTLRGEPSRSLMEDLVQITYLKLWEDGCRLLLNFAIQHPEAIFGYVKKNCCHCHSRRFQAWS